MSKFKNFPHLIHFHLEGKPTNHKFLNSKEKGKWQRLSIDEYLEQIKWSSLGLKKLGIKTNSLIGLMAPSSTQWVIMDQAIMSNGSTTVPFFENVSLSNLKYQIKETNLKVMVISGKKALESIIPILPKLKTVIYHDIDKKSIPYKKSQFISYEKLLNLGEKESNRTDFQKNLMKIKLESVATIVYTSGTTGEPKGVMLTHQNLIHQITAIRERFPLSPLKDSAVSCLPLAHIFERAVVYLHISSGIPTYFCPNLTQVGDIIREVQPTVLVVVPRILEKVYEKMRSSYKTMTGIKKWLVKSAIKRAETKNINSPLKQLDQLFDKLVYKKFNEALGGKSRIIVSGGAALHSKVYRFFRNAHLNIAEGYGLTETCPVIAANDFTSNTPYTVGRLFPGVKVQIKKDGEIWTKSESVMKGYYKKPKATQEVLTEDGWFKTGDLGSLDDQGNLIIRGRKKELFKLQNGKYVVPIPIEQAMEQCEFIENAMAVGDGEKYVGILLFVNPDHEVTEEDEQIIKTMIFQLNQTLEDWERIVKFKIIFHTLSIDNGDITPKMNIRRNALQKRYEKEIDKLYR